MDLSVKISWVVWGILLVLSAVYVIVGARAFDTLGDIEERFENSEDSEGVEQIEANLRGGRAACVLSMIGVLAYAGYSLMFMLRRWFSEHTLDGIMFGILLTASFYTSAFMLLTGTILEANNLVVKHNRSSDVHNGYKASYGLAYSMTAVYILLIPFHVYYGLQRRKERILQSPQVMVSTQASAPRYTV